MLTPKGLPVLIGVRRMTKERLYGTCFRGSAIKRAGNFFRWTTAAQLLNDENILFNLLDEADLLWDKKDFGTHSVEITHPDIVGWESTTDQELAADAIEEVRLGRNGSGMRLKPNRIDVLAPLTQKLTIIFEFKPVGNSASMTVHSVYPGCDVGELMGDVTAREKRIFFDWNHPGEE